MFIKKWSWNHLHFQILVFGAVHPRVHISEVMATSTDLTDEEMVAKAQGVDVLSCSEVECLSTKARSVTSWRLRSFFNTREGWMLRRVARGHHVNRTQRTYCALCGSNLKGALRPMTTGKCTLCHAPLCTIPREGEAGLSCFEEWHQRDVLNLRVYRTNQRNAQSDADECAQQAAGSAEPSPAVENLRQQRVRDERGNSGT